MQKTTPAKNKVLLNILWIGLLTGTLDGLAALILNYKISPAIVFKFIASGVFGKVAFKGGNEMVASGIVFHYLIAIMFTNAFYLLYPFFKRLFHNAYVIAVAYGCMAWIIMNLLVVPVSKIGLHPIKTPVILIGVAVLIICIGLPIALIADRHYKEGKFNIADKK
jgi:ABC-type multidrug transport system permease subunit